MSAVHGHLRKWNLDRQRPALEGLVSILPEMERTVELYTLGFSAHVNDVRVYLRRALDLEQAIHQENYGVDEASVLERNFLSFVDDFEVLVDDAEVLLESYHEGVLRRFPLLVRKHKVSGLDRLYCHQDFMLDLHAGALVFGDFERFGKVSWDVFEAAISLREALLEHEEYGYPEDAVEHFYRHGGTAPTLHEGLDCLHHYHREWFLQDVAGRASVLPSYRSSSS